MQQTEPLVRLKLDQPNPPAWWPEGKPYEGLREGWAYKDDAGRWRDHAGVLLSRKMRRRAGLR